MARARKKKNPKVERRRIRARGDYRVFVSHATTDKWIATAICEKIEGVGASTFRDDRDINGGDDIPDAIRREIKKSNELLLLMTPDSVNRPWVLLEVGAFWVKNAEARIVPVTCHAKVENIPNMLQAKKAISINEFDSYLGQLANRVRKQAK